MEPYSLIRTQFSPVSLTVYLNRMNSPISDDILNQRKYGNCAQTERGLEVVSFSK